MVTTICRYKRTGYISEFFFSLWEAQQTEQAAITDLLNIVRSEKISFMILSCQQ